MTELLDRARSEGAAPPATASELRRYFERAQRLRAEQREFQELVRDFWAEVKQRGHDVKALKILVREAERDAEQAAADRALLEYYRDLIGDGPLFEAVEDAAPRKVRLKRRA